MKTIHFLAMCVALALYGWTIPRTVFPVPEKRSMDAKAIAEAAPYLALSPEKYIELVPKEGPAPVILDTEEQSSAYNSTICPFCGKIQARILIKAEHNFPLKSAGGIVKMDYYVFGTIYRFHRFINYLGT